MDNRGCALGEDWQYRWEHAIGTGGQLARDLEGTKPAPVRNLAGNRIDDPTIN